MQKGLGLLEMKQTPIEKYQYLSVLRNTNVHLFYRLLAGNVKVSISKERGIAMNMRTNGLGRR